MVGFRDRVGEERLRKILEVLVRLVCFYSRYVWVWYWGSLVCCSVFFRGCFSVCFYSVFFWAGWSLFLVRGGGYFEIFKVKVFEGFFGCW